MEAQQLSTRAIHVGSEPDPYTNAVIPPLSLSTTFVQNGVGNLGGGGFEYSRSANPNRQALESNLASLENGSDAFAFSSGSAATQCAIQMLSTGAHVLSVSDVYGGTFRYLAKVGSAVQGLETTFIDLNDDEKVIYDAIRDNTKLIWIETPTNPTLRVISTETIVRIAKSHPAKPLILVDNTFLSPYFSNPLDHGADIVLHSISKYIGGHSDVIMGALIVRKGLPEVSDKIRFLQNAGGSIPSPFDCYLTTRGIKTLALRSIQHGISAHAVASFLENHPLVDSVIYPGLPSHPSHSIAKKAVALRVWKDLKKRGVSKESEEGFPFGGMVSFRIKGGAAEADRFLTASHLFTLAESLGGVESLAEVPDKMTHAGIPEEERLKLGITPNFIRLSVGIEDTDDLLADLNYALQTAVGGK
ncbi:Cystathionine beta-lyases/cystathionine gamma-synthases [Phaffia rhodozyma]|uniref:cystathionine gamma-lyase n=1 Tax=Phaffia rhodozyma TaxID=264483 RepID=A0A0F7SW21_PHARH|nr:Cystathionine beta-lyases/cystathionine gamma-synthases [Phaffia rhodozyma]